MKFLLRLLAKFTNSLHWVLKHFINEETLDDFKPIPLCHVYGRNGINSPAFVGHNTAPTVTTDSASNIDASSFDMGGNITDTGGVNATVRGFAYVQGSGGTPTTGDNVVNESGSFGTGAYSLNISGLSPGTVYSVRAYATNAEGTAYGSTVEVTTASNQAPTVSLDSPADTGSTTDTTPDFSFTGTDNESEDIRYHIQIDPNNTFDSVQSTPAFVQAASNGSNSVTLSSPPTEGNLLVFTASRNNNTAFTTPTGFTAMASVSNGNPLSMYSQMFYKFAESGESSTFTTNTAGDTVTGIAEYSNVEGLDVQNAAFRGSGGTTTFDSPSVTPSGTGNGLVIGFAGTRGVVTFSNEQVNSSTTGVTERTEVGAGTGASLVIYDYVDTTGLSGSYVAEATSSASQAGGAHIAIFNAKTEPYRTAVSGTDSGFTGSPDNTDPYTSGQQVTYTPPTALVADTYYWRVRGIDPSGSNSYGNYSTTRSLTITDPNAPTVTTNAESGVLDVQFTANGNITDIGGSSIIERGFVYMVGAGTPTLANSVVNETGTFSTGTYSLDVTGLDPSTLYTYRAYAKNSTSTAYGSTEQVTTLAPLPKVRNLQQYASDNTSPLPVGSSLLSPEQPTLMYDLTVGTDAESTTIVPYLEAELVGTAFDDVATDTGTTFWWNPDMYLGIRGAGLLYNPDMDGFIMTHGSLDTSYPEQAWLLIERGGQWKWREMTVRDSSGSVVTSYDGTQAPEGRYYPMFTWDSQNGHGIFFGGYNGTDFGDTWRLWFGSAEDDEPEWWEISPAGSPPAARSNIHNSCCYDEDGAKSWLFGGWGATYYNDLYEFDSSTFNGTWTQLDSGTGTAPPVTRNGSLIFDELNNRLIQFGGHNGTTARNTTWEYDLTGGAWSEMTGLGTPPAARELHTATYDSVNQRMIVYSGNSNGSSGTFYRDVWELDLTSGSEAWTNITPSNADNMPLATYTSSAARDTKNNLMLIVGGVDSDNDTARRETAIDLNVATSPALVGGLNWNNKYRPLDAPAYAYNPDADEFVMTLGFQHIPDNTTIANGNHGTATHIYDPTNNKWRNGVVGNMTPFQREGSLMVYDTTRNRFILFGGLQGISSCLNDTWELVRNTNGDYKWNRLQPTGTLPTKRWLMAGGFDPVNNRMIVWGGQDAGFIGNELSDVWELDFSSSADGAWSQLTPTGTGPTAASGTAYAVDTTNNHLYIAGGATNGDGTYSNQFYQLDMNTASTGWTSRSTFTTARRSSVLTYDNTNGRMVLFGGWSGSSLNDSQAFNISGNSWGSLSPTGTVPDGRRSHAGFAKDNVHYFTAGRPGTGTWYNDTQRLTVTTYNSSSAWLDMEPTIYQKGALPQTGLAGNYHWQGWAGSSTKVSFGGNAESAVDFGVIFYKVHGTDALKRKENTESHTTSSNLNDVGNFTYEDVTVLPTNDSLLANPYDATDFTAVGTDDASRKLLTGSGILIEQGWVYHSNNTDEITINWNGQTDLAPSSSTVYLQIYNFNTTAWETLDSDNTTVVDTDFTLTGTQTTSLSNYYGTNNRVAFRVYQENI